MRNSQKIALTVLISLFITGGFGVIAYTGLFTLLENDFFRERVMADQTARLTDVAKVVVKWNSEIEERFTALAGDRNFQAVFSSESLDKGIGYRASVSDSLEDNLNGFVGMRIVDGEGRIQHSTFAGDIASEQAPAEGRDGRRLYRNWEQISETFTLNTPDSTSVAYSLLNGVSGQVVFLIPAKDTGFQIRGWMIVYMSPSGLGEKLAAEGMIGAAGRVEVIDKRGVIVDIRPEQVESVRSGINLLWPEGGSPDDFGALAEVQGEKFYLASTVAEDGIWVGKIVPGNLLAFNPIIKVLILLTVFISVNLTLFLFMNIRQDKTEIIRSRLNRLQVNLTRDWLEKPENRRMTEADLESRREEVKKELRSGLGRLGEHQVSKVDEIIDEGWNRIIEILAVRKTDSVSVSGGSDSSTGSVPPPIDMKKLEEMITRAVAEAKFVVPPEALSGFHIQGAVPTVRPAPGRPIKKLEVVEDGDLEDLDEVTDLESGDEVEDLDEVVDLEAGDELEDLEDLADLDSEDEVDDLEDVADLDAGDEVEDLEDVAGLDEEDEVEDLGDTADLEAGDEVEDLGDVADTEDFGLGDQDVSAGQLYEETEDEFEEIEQLAETETQDVGMETTVPTILEDSEVSQEEIDDTFSIRSSIKKVEKYNQFAQFVIPSDEGPTESDQGEDEYEELSGFDVVEDLIEIEETPDVFLQNTFTELEQTVYGEISPEEADSSDIEELKAVETEEVLEVLPVVLSEDNRELIEIDKVGRDRLYMFDKKPRERKSVPVGPDDISEVRDVESNEEELEELVEITPENADAGIQSGGSVQFISIEMIQKQVKANEVAEKAMSVGRSDSTDSMESLIKMRTTGLLPGADALDVDFQFDVDEAELSWTVDGLNYDQYLRGYKKGTTGIYRSLMSLSKDYNAICGVLLAGSRKGLETDYSVGLNDDCATHLSVTRNEPVWEEWFSDRKIVFIPNLSESSYAEKTRHNEFRYIRSAIFVPAVYHGSQSYLFFGFKDVPADPISLLAGVKTVK